MDNKKFDEKIIKEFISFLDNDLNFISKNLEMINKQLKDKLGKIVLGFTAYLDNNFEFVKDNLSKLNSELNKAFKDTFEEKIIGYPYFKEHRFSPLVKHIEILLKPTQETANTKLLTLFLNKYDFKDKLLKSLTILLKDEDKQGLIQYPDNLRINNVESEVPIKNGRIDILCTCNENINGKNQIVIEAKIRQREQDSQTINYYKAKKKTAFAFIYLTKEASLPKCKKFINITWLNLAAAFYAAYNSYKYCMSQNNCNINIDAKWGTINFSKIEDTNEGIFFQMWLSNILTHLYGIEDINGVLEKDGTLKENEYRQINQSVSFIEKYEYIMEKIYGK